jgi:hypothetical protein
MLMFHVEQFDEISHFTNDKWRLDRKENAEIQV